jgi:hypothetical protein
LAVASGISTGTAPLAVIAVAGLRRVFDLRAGAAELSGNGQLDCITSVAAAAVLLTVMTSPSTDSVGASILYGASITSGADCLAVKSFFKNDSIINLLVKYLVDRQSKYK